jgi:hypothetical protein
MNTWRQKEKPHQSTGGGVTLPDAAKFINKPAHINLLILVSITLKKMINT